MNFQVKIEMKKFSFLKIFFLVFVTDGENKTLPNHYLSCSSGNWVDGMKKLLEIELFLVSTVQVTGKLIHSFLANPFDLRTFMALPGEEPIHLIHFMPLIINRLLEITASDKIVEKPKYIPLAKKNEDENGNQFSVIESIQSQSDIISKSERFSDSAFSTFVHIVSILVENGQKENLLKFIEDKLDLPKFPNLCDSVLSAIVNLLERVKKSVQFFVLVQNNRN